MTVESDSLLPVGAIISKEGDALAVHPCFQSLQAFEENDFPFGKHCVHIGFAVEHTETPCGRQGAAAYFIAGITFEMIEHLRGRGAGMFFVEPGDGGPAAQGAVSANVVSVMDVSGKVAPERLEKPWGMLLVKVAHVVAKSPFELPVGLGMVYRRVDQPDACLLTERGKKISFEAGAIIKDDRLRE